MDPGLGATNKRANLPSINLLLCYLDCDIIPYWPIPPVRRKMKRKLERTQYRDTFYVLYIYGAPIFKHFRTLLR